MSAIYDAPRPPGSAAPPWPGTSQNRTRVIAVKPARGAKPGEEPWASLARRKLAGVFFSERPELRALAGAIQQIAGAPAESAGAGAGAFVFCDIHARFPGAELLLLCDDAEWNRLVAAGLGGDRAPASLEENRISIADVDENGIALRAINWSASALP
jgi:hypothetical protein